MTAFCLVRHALLGAALLLPSMAGYADDGDADAQFGIQGRAIHSWPLSTFEARSNAVTTAIDGSVVVAGWFRTSAPQTREAISLLRFRPDGSADASFGNAGVAQFDIDPYPQAGRVAIGVFALTGGRTEVLLTRVINSTGQQPLLLSLLADGTPDPGFGTNGLRAISITRWNFGEVEFHASRMAEDGRILMAGTLEFEGSSDVLVARILPSGEIDPTFGDEGWTRIGSDEPLIATAVALDDLGRIVIAGSTDVIGEDDRPMVARLGADGMPDAGFGDGGLVRVDTGLSGDWSADAVVGAIRTIAGGFLQRRLFLAISRPVPTATGILALTNDGSIATTFGNDGFVDLSLEEGSRITTLAMRRDLRLVAAGSIDPNGAGRTDFLVARMAFDGTPDATFDGNGRARYPMNADGDTVDIPAAMVLSGERPVIAGSLMNFDTGSRHTGVLRLSSDLIFRHGFE